MTCDYLSTSLKGNKCLQTIWCLQRNCLATKSFHNGLMLDRSRSQCKQNDKASFGWQSPNQVGVNSLCKWKPFVWIFWMFLDHVIHLKNEPWTRILLFCFWLFNPKQSYVESIKEIYKHCGFLLFMTQNHPCETC